MNKPMILGVALLVVAAGWFANRFYETYSAENAFEIADQAGRGDDACTAARNVAAIYLKHGDQESYSDWSRRADIACYNAGASLGR